MFSLARRPSYYARSVLRLHGLQDYGLLHDAQLAPVHTLRSLFCRHHAAILWDQGGVWRRSLSVGSGVAPHCRLPWRPGDCQTRLVTLDACGQPLAQPDPDSVPSQLDTDVQLPRRFATVTDMFGYIVNTLPGESRPFRLTWRQYKKTEWECQLVATWPEPAVFVARARSKKEAGRLAKTRLIRWLQNGDRFTPSGDLVLYSKQEMRQKMATMWSTPRLHVDPSLTPHADDLYERLKMVRSSVRQWENEEQQQQQQQQQPQQDESDETERRWSVVGGPDHLWSSERRQHRSDRMQTALLRRLELCQRPGSEEARCAKLQQSLPISSWRSEILSAVERHRVVVVRGETGSGKSTQVPQMLLDAWSERGRGVDCNVLVTQPRRIAAVSLARRIAQLRGEQLRDSVGYQVRLDSCLPHERGGVLFCTIGVVLARLRDNPSFKGVSHLIIDEVHERCVQTDMLLLLVRRLLQHEPHLRVVLMSASLDARLFSDYFDGAPIIEVPGRVYPVKRHFLEDLGGALRVRGDVLSELRQRDGQQRPTFAPEAVAHLVAAVCRHRPPGAVLVFLEGMGEIKQVEERLRQMLPDPTSTQILAVSGRLSSQEQQAIFGRPPPGVRKVVLATNVAETGITVDDVVHVVDTGAVKQARLDPETGIDCLRTEWIAQANVKQRQGRAGRVQPGESYHLYSRRRLQQMDQFETPELLRASLETVVLNSKHLSADLRAEEFLGAAIQPPPADAVRAALVELRRLQMLDDEERLTPLGQLAARFELHPRQVRLLVYGVMFRCLEPALTVIGWEMNGRDPFLGGLERRPELLELKRSYSRTSDPQVAVEIFRAFLRQEDHRDFCDRNLLFRNGLRTVQSLIRMVVRQLHQTRLVDDHHEHHLMSAKHPLNECAHHWGVVTAALIAGHVKNVARIQKGAVLKGRVRPKDIVIRCSDGVADTAGDSVNRKPDGRLPFLAYGSSFFSSQRRRRVLRDTSQASGLQVALCYGDRHHQLSRDAATPPHLAAVDTGLQTLRVSCGGEYPLHVQGESSAIRCVRQLRAVLRFTLHHQLETDVAGRVDPHRDEVGELHVDAVRLLARLLQSETERAPPPPPPPSTPEQLLTG